jgi:HSP20 family protein
MLTRWQPLQSVFRDLSQWQNQMESLLGTDLLTRAPGFVPTVPTLNVYEDEHSLYVEAELPGMELDQIDVTVTGGNELTIKGERHLPSVEKGVWHRQERQAGQFERTITLPTAIDTDKVEAKLVHGVLTVTLPKSEAAKPRKIAVKAD